MFHPRSDGDADDARGVAGMRPSERPSTRPQMASAGQKRDEGYHEWARANQPAKHDSDSDTNTAVAYL